MFDTRLVAGHKCQAATQTGPMFTSNPLPNALFEIPDGAFTEEKRLSLRPGAIAAMQTLAAAADPARFRALARTLRELAELDRDYLSSEKYSEAGRGDVYRRNVSGIAVTYQIPSVHSSGVQTGPVKVLGVYYVKM